MLTFTGPSLFATTVDSSGFYKAAPGQQFTVHVGKNGAQFTGVTTLSGTPLGGVVTAAADGSISFADPTDTYRVLWLRDGAGNWIPVAAVETAAEVNTAIDQAQQAIAQSSNALNASENAAGAASDALVLAQQAIDASAVVQVGADLGVPVTVAHRGGGTVWPEESVEGMDAAAAARFAVECDVQPLADGTLVCCHDNTVDRTMVGGIGTGNVGSKTLAQWRLATIRPAIRGGKAGTPTTFTDVLDRFGGRVEVWAELKSNNYSATVRDRFIAAIKARNLQKAVVCQTFTYSLAQQFAAAGLRVAFLTGASTTYSFADIKAAGIEYWSPSTSVTQTDVTAARGVGLKVAVYTVTDAAGHATQAAKGVDAIFSDDPWGSSSRVPVAQSAPYRDGCKPYGLYRGGADSLGDLALVDGGIGWPASGTSGPPNNNTARWSMPWAGPINFPVRIESRLRIGPASTLSGGIGFLLLTNSIESFVDGANAGQNGWAFLLRKNQQFNAWEYVNGTSAAPISGLSVTVPGTAPTVLTEYEEYTIALTITSSAITVQLAGRGGSVSASATHSRAWGNLNLGGRSSLFGSMASLSVVSL